MLEFLAFAWINLLGVMSPGPDFAIVTRYGFTGSRKAALFATAGISIALLIHVSYCILGMAFFLQNSPLLFRIFQIAGACYLGYLGINLLKTKGSTQQPKEKFNKGAFKDGFFTNLFNPKCTLFTLSLFTQFIHPNATFYKKILYGTLLPITAFIWFGFLSYLLTHPTFLPKLKKRQIIFTRVMGFFLIMLSLYIFISS